MSDVAKGGQPGGRRRARAADRGTAGAPTPAPAPAPAPIELSVDVGRVQRTVWAFGILVAGLDVVASISGALGAAYPVTRFFDGDYKVNVPTGYKVGALLVVTLLLGLLRHVARREGDPFATGWSILMFVAAFACLDETVYLHQALGDALHQALHTSGVLTLAWVILYVPAAIAVGVVLVRHLKSAPPELVKRLGVGGGLVVGGAVLLEPAKSLLADGADRNSLLFKAVASVSDCGELIGLTALVVVLVGELARRASAVALLIPNVSAPAPAERLSER